MHQKRNGIDTGRSRQLQSADRDTLVTVANVGPAVRHHFNGIADWGAHFYRAMARVESSQALK